jgi:hypothetical protein
VGATCQRRFPPPRAHSLPLSAQWGQDVAASCLRPRAPSSLSASRARFARHQTVALARPLSLSLAAPWDPPVSSAFPAPRRGPACSFAHVAGILGHVARPHPNPFLSTARARTHSPIPFCIALLSLALCPRRSASPETRARRAGLLARRRPRQATPSSAPR